MARNQKTIPFGKEIKKGSVGSILAKLFREIMDYIGMDGTRFDDLIRRYIQKALLDPNRVERATARASLGKDLLKVSMTWKTFIKGLAFLNVLRFELIIKLYHANGKMTEHHLPISLDEIDFENIDKDDGDD